MESLRYPFDSMEILKRKKRIKRELLEQDTSRIPVKIAALGGSSTQDIVQVLELFLLDQGLTPSFYESDYGCYWQEAMFPPEELLAFQPDIVYIHTSFRNLESLPHSSHSKEEIEGLLERQFQHFFGMWERLEEAYGCTIIQNNFERPPYRLLGNQDIAQAQGRSNFVSRLNQKIYEYSQEHSSFFVHDIDYLSGQYGLNAWSDPGTWYLYKYCMAIAAIPAFAYSLANIVKSLYGKNKKVIACDLDNTLWGGVIGEEGAERIALGPEFPLGQAYVDFQRYLKAQKELGVLLCINSKNELGNALEGLAHPDGALAPEDFAAMRINWQRKDQNLAELARELNLGEDSFVFLDDNPAEREIVRRAATGTAAPPLENVESYISTVDQAGYFEVTRLSTEDRERSVMYEANRQREQAQQSFESYEAYLQSLDMRAEIGPFQKKDLPRIAQLINKTNQFNLTTRRCSEEEIRGLAANPQALVMAGRLEDRFGDNGLVSAVTGHVEGEECIIDIWVMSCRVFQRQLEWEMMNACVARCREMGCEYLTGIYTSSAKNHIVENFYEEQGFKRGKKEGDIQFWRLKLSEYQRKETAIIVNGEEK